MAKHGGNLVVGGVVVAETRGWLLYRVGVDSDWLHYKLVAKTRQRKANFWLSGNGERLAMGRDAVLLNTHWPYVFDWVSDVVRQDAVAAKQPANGG